MGTDNVEIIDIDAPVKPGAVPGSVFDEIKRWAPVIAQLVAGIKAALASGTLSIPAIHLRIFGKHIKMGPIPLGIEP